MSTVEQALQRIPRWRFALWLALATVALAVLAYSPRFENWNRGYPYSWETSRGAGFLMQSQHPFRTDVEPAIRWRLLPPLLCYAVGLRGVPALVVPWAGVLALLASTAWMLLGRAVSRVTTVLGVLLLGTTSAVIISVGWLGMNDAWVWCGLTVIALARNHPARCGWAWLGPWIDERLLIGLPLAVLLHAKLAGFDTWRALLRRNRLVLCGAALYALTRVLALAFVSGDPSGGFVQWTVLHVHEWLPNAVPGWWEGLRAAWVLVGLALIIRPHSRLPGLNAALTVQAVVTVAIMVLLAADLSRSAAIMVPAAVVAACQLERDRPSLAAGIVALLLVANLAMPAATVIGPYTLWLENFVQHNLGRG